MLTDFVFVTRVVKSDYTGDYNQEKRFLAKVKIMKNNQLSEKQTFILGLVN